MRKIKIEFLLSLFFVVVFMIPTYGTGIKGQNKAYAGKNIRFYTYTDPVSRKFQEVFILKFDQQGNFNASAPVSSTTYAFSDFGVYRGMMFLEPGKDYELLFPPLREKSFADEKNPFFEPVEFWFATGNPSINKQVTTFENKLNELTARFFNRLYFRQSREVYDSLVMLVNQEFPKNPSSAFEWHKKLRLKAIETEAFRLKPAQAAKVLSEVPATEWNHPAFIDLFDNVLANKLSFEIKSTEGAKLHKAVAAGDLQFLMNFINTSYGIKGDVAALAAIKLLHDGFYTGEFRQEVILKMLNSTLLTGNKNKAVSEAAKNTIDKLRFLMPGTKAPVICLNNIDGKKICTDEFPNKFKYLIFADTEMVVCQEQLKYLSEIEKKYGQHLQIIIVLKKTDPVEMKKFLKDASIPGVKLVDETGEYINRYHIKSFPETILLDEDHEVVFPHTKAPLDGFEQQFSVWLQQQLFERQRNQAR